MPRYGTIDFDYAGRLATCAPDDDGPVLMVNFMNYRERASYDDGSDGGRTGREADDEYAPVDVLTEIGATVVYLGDVIDDSASTGWHRIGIVQYPSRRAFIEMQSRSDFREKHTHKEAGMDHTIVFCVAPRTIAATIVEGRSSRAVFDLVRRDDIPTAPTAPTARQAVGPVEGTIMGDGRVWTELRISWLADGDDLPPTDEVADRERVVVRTTIDRLSNLIAAATATATAATAATAAAAAAHQPHPPTEA